MPKVTFYPSEQVILVEAGCTILDAVRTAGLVLESPCNAMEICGKCKVKIDAGSMSNISFSGEHCLSNDELSQGYVLACGTRIGGDIAVTLADPEQNDTLQIISQGNVLELKPDSYIKREYDPGTGQSKIYAGDRFIGIETDASASIYGMVVDIGTTTLVAALVDLESGRELGSKSTLNPQAVYAQDVLSRIKMASEAQGLATLHTLVIAAINQMIAELSQENGIKREQIYELVFSGNTCMLHLAAGVSPYSLGKYPYEPKIYGGEYWLAQDLGIAAAPLGVIYMPSIISAFIGADISSGILAAQLHRKKGVTLFVDIGTNGEMVIACHGSIAATSTAAGPAFEGMNISHGMRAAQGAIEYFAIDNSGAVTVRTIGNADPTGICGSGIMDIVGELAAHRLITNRGKLVDPSQSFILPALQPRFKKLDGKMAFEVAANTYITQKDIRQVQLAKGAVRAGIDFLLRSQNLNAIDVDRVLIAGSFGYHLQAQSLINLGLLPGEFKDKIEFVGNTSKSGGMAYLLNIAYRDEMDQRVKEIQVIELANYKDFDKVFVSCLDF
ncbi:MAG: ASKHA domain-containing protein [Syntrophomonadaceae bacterium]|nr:ASKHA domain-containing protein [Syntrophomonadaceae bacterium]